MKTTRQLQDQVIGLLWPDFAEAEGLTYSDLITLDKQRVDRIVQKLIDASEPETDSFTVELGGQRFTAAQWAAVLVYVRAMKDISK